MLRPARSTLPVFAIELVAEALAAQGQLNRLALFNATSKTIHDTTLPVLWRTVIWDPKGKTKAQRAESWRMMMVDSPGAKYIE